MVVKFIALFCVLVIINYLIKSARSSAVQSGLGFLIPPGMVASYFSFAVAFPPEFISVSTCSSVQSSSFTDKTCHHACTRIYTTIFVSKTMHRDVTD